MTLLVIGCGKSIDAGPVSVAPRLPALPIEFVQECVDPGVDPNAIVALTETRLALAECKRRHQNTVRFYDELKRDLEQ